MAYQMKKTVLMVTSFLSIVVHFLMDIMVTACYTFCVGEVSDEVKKTAETTKEALYLGIESAVAGKHLGDIGSSVQEHCEKHGYGVVRELVGHGWKTDARRSAGSKLWNGEAMEYY